jgi:L-iditol 2-dehydrogenase
MLATRLLATGRVSTVEVAIPEPGPGEILVGIEAAGLCGTDRHLFKGEFPCKPPITLGHEFSGIVTACGSGVTIPQGARITCDPNIACGTCDQCDRGRVNLCRNLVAIGIHRDGGFADYAVIPAHRAFVLPQDIDPLHGAFCEPLACTMHGVDLAAIQAAERVTVVGGGVIGLLAVQLAVLAGAEVMLVTRQKPKRDLAMSFGAAATVASIRDAETMWRGGADVVLECAGTGDTVAKTPRLTRAGGRIVILGVLPKGEQVAVEPFDLLVREISVLYSFLNPHTHARAADLIAKGRIEIAPLITRTIGLAELPDAVAHDPRPGEVKVLAVPG